MPGVLLFILGIVLGITVHPAFFLICVAVIVANV